jgi:hypothetical protein
MTIGRFRNPNFPNPGPSRRKTITQKTLAKSNKGRHDGTWSYSIDVGHCLHAPRPLSEVVGQVVLIARLTFFQIRAEPIQIMKKKNLWLAVSIFLILSDCSTDLELTPSENDSEFQEDITVPHTEDVQTIGGGFEPTPIETAPGIKLWRKTKNVNGVSEYIQEIDLSAGATIAFLTGSNPTATGTTPRPPIRNEYFSTFWSMYQTNPKLFSITNGTFAEQGSAGTSSQVSFAIKNGYTIRTCGYDNNNGLAKRILRIFNSYATITAFNPCPTADLRAWQCNAFEPVRDAIGTTVPTALVGFDPAVNANGRMDQPIGRTYVGIKDKNGDGLKETVLIYTCSNATQSQAYQALLNVGASKIIMYDGSGATNMRTRTKQYIIPNDGRAITNIIAVINY